MNPKNFKENNQYLNDLISELEKQKQRKINASKHILYYSNLKKNWERKEQFIISQKSDLRIQNKYINIIFERYQNKKRKLLLKIMITLLCSIITTIFFSSIFLVLFSVVLSVINTIYYVYNVKSDFIYLRHIHLLSKIGLIKYNKIYKIQYKKINCYINQIEEQIEQIKNIIGLLNRELNEIHQNIDYINKEISIIEEKIKEENLEKDLKKENSQDIYFPVDKIEKLQKEGRRKVYVRLNKKGYFVH